MSAHAECGVEQKHALLCPAGQTSRYGGIIYLQIVGQFPVNIFEGRRNPDARRDGKCKTVSLSVVVIRILSQDDRPDFFRRCGETSLFAGKNLISGVGLCCQKCVDFLGQRIGHIWQQQVAPCSGYIPSYGHKLSIPPARII